MSLASPSTYAEWYWKHGVDATKEFDESLERVFAPYFSGMFADLPDIAQLPTGIQNFVRLLAEPPSAGFGGFALGVGVEMVDEVLHSTLNPAMLMLSRAINKRAREKWLTTSEAATLFQRRKITEELWQDIFAAEGYEDIVGQFYYLSQFPYPSISDIMLWGRYHGDPLNTRGTVWEKIDVPAVDYDMYEWLTLQRLSSQDAHTLFRRGLFSKEQLADELKKIGWRGPDIDYKSRLGWSIPNALLITQGGLQQALSQDAIIKSISKADIHPDYAELYYDAILTKPSSSDIVSLELRRDPSLANLSDRLRKIGIHPEYWDLYKELSYVIPPVQDIITMAVREAFTPAIAERFGQYEDFPEPLAEWGAKKGLSREWTERYWAAHWALPSPTQGFSMLHRGVITQDELNLLLRAQDVMPFWRDKLTQIAYRPLTRVDVRRMYKEGILDEGGVYTAYLEHGYSEKNAEAMTEFTIKYVLSQQAKFTSTDVLKAYTNRMIERSEAYSLLVDLGIRGPDADYIMSRAEYKRLWDLTDEKIKGIKNLYKKGVYNANKARAELLKLAMPAEQVSVLFEQWWYEKTGELAPTWTKAETLRFLKAGKIDENRARAEFQRMGYDEEHIELYIGDEV